MLRVVLARGTPQSVQRGAWFPVTVMIRNESNTYPSNIGPFYLTVSAMFDELHSIRGQSIIDVRQSSTNQTNSQLAFDAHGQVKIEIKFLKTCTRQHYGDAHTSSCLHRIRQPLMLKFAAKATTNSNPVLDVISDNINILVDDVSASTLPASSSPVTLSLVQRRVYTCSFGSLITCERPTVVIDGYSHVVWDAAFLLVKYLDQCPRSLLMNRKVIEVGAGAGVVGIAAACLGAHVTLTDLPEALDLTQLNVAANSSALKTARGSVTIAPLTWGDLKDLSTLRTTSPAADVILASDVVYQDALFEPLVQTLCQLAGPRSTVLLSIRERHGCDFELFMQCLSQHFSVSLLSLTGSAAQVAHAAVISKAKRVPNIFELKLLL